VKETSTRRRLGSINCRPRVGSWRCCYDVCGVLIQSNVPLLEARAVRDATPDLSFEVMDDPDRAGVFEGSKGDASEAQPQSWPVISANTSGYRLSFGDCAEFFVDARAQQIDCSPGLGVPMETIRHLFLDHVFPRALSLRGNIVLHASAVSLDGQSVAFLGPAGEGKSTLATSFAAAGWRLLADDSLCIRLGTSGEVDGVPSYPGTRLHPEDVLALLGERVATVPVAHYAAKLRLGAETPLKFAKQPVPIERIYVLNRSHEKTRKRRVRIDRPGLSEAFVELVRHTFQLDLEDSQGHRRYLRSVAPSVVPRLVRRLTFPTGHRALALVRRAVLEDLQNREERQ